MGSTTCTDEKEGKKQPGIPRGERNLFKATIGTILEVDWAEIGVAQFFKVPTTRNLGISSLQLMGLEPKSGGTFGRAL